MPKLTQQVTKKDIQVKISYSDNRVMGGLEKMEFNVCKKIDALILKCENFLKRLSIKYRD
nr:hypothetical protein [uncultured archaeon]